ncbi:MAG TPA: hypothetical protein VJ885_00090 [Thermoanaerobaculia bacterium]|nr:hypothetical protein [Thermoanaerobaculia bacterium]
METTTVMMGAFRKRRLAALGLFGLASLLSAQPGLAEAPARTDIELVRQVASQNDGPGSAKAFQWAADLDIVAQGLAKLLKDPAAMDTLRTQMMASQLPENTVRLVDLLGVKVQGRGARFGTLLAKEAGMPEAKMRVTLAAFPVPITLFFPREEDRHAVLKPEQGRGRSSLQVSWDGFWIPQKNLKTLLAYDHSGKRTRYPVTAPPAGPVLVVSTENSEKPEAPSRSITAPMESVSAATCFTPYVELAGLYLGDGKEGWPRGKPEFELFLADWDASMPGHHLLIRPTTHYLFGGRNVTDAAGRTRYLPDVNDTGRWYNFTPIAMFAYNDFIGSGLYAIEDDDDDGVLKITSGSYSIGFSCSYFPGCTGSQCSGCSPTGSGLVNLARAIFGTGDDRFDVPFRSVGGAPFDTIMEVSMGDWRLRYRVACPS